MRRIRLPKWVALVLALLVPVAALRVSASRCRMADCDDPCCQTADGPDASIAPLLPCCATVAAAHPSPPATMVRAGDDPSPLVSLAVAIDDVAVPLIAHAVAPPTRLHPPGPPLYRQHSSLLL